MPRIVALLEQQGASDIRVVVGGVIPDDDIEPLRKLGIAEVFGQDTPPDDIVARVRDLAAARPTE